jgi:hypothetical protein
MPVSSVCHTFNEWMHAPIDWKEERVKLIVITSLVLAILAFGVVCYTYVGGRFAQIPGYNQGYAYFLWALCGGIALGTGITYSIRNILSKIPVHNVPPQSGSNVQPAPYDFKQLSFKSALTKNKEIRWLTKGIETSITELSPEESTDFNLKAFYKNKDWTLQKVLPIFERNGSPLLAGRRESGSWFIAARIQCRTKTGDRKDGMILITQNTHHGATSSWWVHCKIDGLSRDDMRQEFQDIVFDDPSWKLACQDFLWVKSVLEGKERGLLPLVIQKFEEDTDAGKVSLWKPHA